MEELRLDVVAAIAIGGCLLCLLVTFMSGTLGYAASQHKQEAALMDATTDGDVEAVRSILAAGSVDVSEESVCDDEGATPLHVAALIGQVDLVAILIEAGARLDAKAHGQFGSEPLHVAAFAGRVRVVQQLLQARADADGRDDFDRRPLHVASSKGHTAVVQALLSAGALTSALADDGITARQLAQRNGHTDIVALLPPDTATAMAS